MEKILALTRFVYFGGALGVSEVMSSLCSDKNDGVSSTIGGTGGFSRSGGISAKTFGLRCTSSE